MNSDPPKSLLETLKALSRNKPGGDEVPDTKSIWRYMSIGRLLSLLTSQKLFFPSLENLRRSDPSEGRYRTRKEASRTAAMERRLRELSGLSLLGQELPPSEESVSSAETRRLQEELSGITLFVSCWYMHDAENVSMWRLYGSEGVAIRSTTGKILTAIDLDGMGATPRAVSYSLPSTSTPLDWIFHKREAYRNEREFRVLLNASEKIVQSVSSKNDFIKSVYSDGGMYLMCHVQNLVEQIVVAPGTASWLKDAVAAMVERLALKIPVYASEVEVSE